MIPPSQQWCHQIAVTSACWPKPACSNCTRLLGHEKKRYFMSPDQFEQVLKVAVPFLHHSPPELGLQVNRGNDKLRAKTKCLGIFGGEPLMHPDFPDLVDLMCHYVPDARYRGLWTSLHWKEGESKHWGRFEDQVTRLLGPAPSPDVWDRPGGYINWNMHEEQQKCEHSPVLVAAQDVLKDEKERWDKISDCWLQTEWSAAYALDYNEEPKFYFCEVASSFDRVFNLGTGLPLEDGVWSHHLWFSEDDKGVKRPHGLYAKQILSTCGRCGASLHLPGRRDLECVDDVSVSNLVPLQILGSPMVRKGQIKQHDGSAVEVGKSQGDPWDYIKDDRAVQSENFKKAVPGLDWLNPGGNLRRIPEE